MGPTSLKRRRNLVDFTVLSATIAIVVVALIALSMRTYLEYRADPAIVGLDAQFYFERAASWLAGDGFYLPWQLTGEPYLVETGAVTYPQPALVLFVPFALGVPAVLWWVIPLGVVGYVLIRLRPSKWGWLLLAALLLYPRTWVVVVLGNPSIWILAAMMAGQIWGWPSVAALLKPTFAPLAAIGVRRRSWFLALGVLGAVSLVLLPMWPDYLTAMLNARSARGIEYLLGEWPIALALLLATWRRGVVRPTDAELARSSY